MGAWGGNSAGGGFADLALRTITALIFGAVAMAGMLAGGPYFTLLIATLGAIMVYEWRMIALTMRDRAVAGFQVLAVVGATVMAHFGDMVSALAFLTAIAGAGAAADVILKRPYGWGLIGALYIGFGAICFVGLRGGSPEGLLVIFWVALVVIATDVGAYFSGRMIGGPKLWPRISPNKTWAGLVGAMVLAALISGGFSTLIVGYIELVLVLLGAITAAIAQVGDLSESAYKRLFGVKDSGRILPGHGGVLDRLDGMLAATIFVAIVSFLRGGAPIYQW